MENTYCTVSSKLCLRTNENSDLCSVFPIFGGQAHAYKERLVSFEFQLTHSIICKIDSRPNALLKLNRPCVIKHSSSLVNSHDAIYLSVVFPYVFVSFSLTYTLQPWDKANAFVCQPTTILILLTLTQTLINNVTI